MKEKDNTPKKYTPKGFWTEEKCFQESEKYRTKTAFKTANYPAYNTAEINGWIADWFPKSKILKGKLIQPLTQEQIIERERAGIIEKVKRHSVKYYGGKLRVYFPNEDNNNNPKLALKLTNPDTIKKYLNKNICNNTSEFPLKALEALKRTIEGDSNCGLTLEISNKNLKLTDILKIETLD